MKQYSYRQINVAQLNQQAKERVERDEKHKEYKDWLDKERMRETDTPPEPMYRDFRKKCKRSTVSLNDELITAMESPNYSQFTKTATAYRSAATTHLPITPSPAPSTSSTPPRKNYYQVQAPKLKR